MCCPKFFFSTKQKSIHPAPLQVKWSVPNIKNIRKFFNNTYNIKIFFNNINNITNIFNNIKNIRKFFNNINNFLKITYGTDCCFINYNLLNWGSLKVCYLKSNFLKIGIWINTLYKCMYM